MEIFCHIFEIQVTDFDSNPMDTQQYLITPCSIKKDIQLLVKLFLSYLSFT